jgi:hypothetical protein
VLVCWSNCQAAADDGESGNGTPGTLSGSGILRGYRAWLKTQRDTCR